MNCLTPTERTALVVGIEPGLKRLARKWAGCLGPSHLDDAFQVGWLAAWKAAELWDPALGYQSFLAWCYRPVRWAVLGYVGRELAHLQVKGERANREVDRPDRDLERAEVAVWVRAAVARLGYEERAVVELRYGLGDRHEYTQAAAGRVFGLSHQWAFLAERRALGRLRELLEVPCG
ncbi:MAG TPA: sigma-70 family RNA polymerase sigma factor [bacterium]|nr:sigma-70 family RNA polymerase sigma factor [bacterium]